MAFPIIPKKRSGASGYPTTLEVGELAVNTLDGSLYLGGDSAVMLLNGPVAAGTTVTEHTGDGTTVAFTFAGYNGTADGGYIVSVGGIDQPPSKYAITNTAGGTITFVEAPVAGELISIRALVAGGGGGSGDATSLQGRDIATTAPTDGQVLAWNATTSKWEPTSINGSVSFNSPGSYSWTVPAWVRWVYVSASSGDGSDGIGTDGESGAVGTDAYFDQNGSPIAATTGANGADGIASAGIDGKGISISAISWTLTGGAGGTTGIAGYGGGGSGGAGAFNPDTLEFILPANGAAGNGPYPGGGGYAASNTSHGGGGSAFLPAGYGLSGDQGGFGGNGAETNGQLGGLGGFGGGIYASPTQYFLGGGGGGGLNGSGGGGGGGSIVLSSGGSSSIAGQGGGGKGIPGGAGGTGSSFADPVDFSSVAGTTISIVISEGAGDASITITY